MAIRIAKCGTGVYLRLGRWEMYAERFRFSGRKWLEVERDESATELYMGPVHVVVNGVR